MNKDLSNESVRSHHSVTTRTYEDFVGVLNHIAKGALRNDIPSGYQALDAVLNGGLTTGLYTVIALPGVGKTTFCMSMIPHITAAGHHVIFISLEMTKEQLFIKTACRLSYELFGPTHAYSYRDICDISSKDLETFTAIANAYADEAARTSIITANQINGMDDVVQIVDRYCNELEKPPVLIVDYLQLMAALDNNPNEKQATDNVVKLFREMALVHHMPVILISSVSRAFYGKALTIGSAKESGGIEYTADVLIGLECIKSNTETPGSSTSRAISLKILKNRFGPSDTSIRLRMLPQYGVFFQEDDPVSGQVNHTDTPLEF